MYSVVKVINFYLLHCIMNVLAWFHFTFSRICVCQCVFANCLLQYDNELRHEISNNVVHVCATSTGLDQPVHTHSLIRAFASHSNIL